MEPMMTVYATVEAAGNNPAAIFAACGG